jgi:hypothetical protein
MSLPENVTKLISTYQASQARLIDIIAKAELKGNVTAYRKAILADINHEISKLDAYSKKWAAQEIKAAYASGVNSVMAEVAAKGIDITVASINKSVVKNLVDNVTGQLLEATNYVGRRLADDIRKTSLEAIAMKVSSGDTVKQAKELLIQKLSESGVTSIVDKSGRAINLESYASMVARTTTREATNRGTINAVQSVDGDLVQISSHNSPCPICSVYEGRIYSISGNDKRYPKLDDVFANGYSTIHPNCKHVVTPYFEEFDDNAEENRKQSNRPFVVDKDKKADIEAYYRDQATKAARRADRNLYEKVKLVAPKEAPKTFSGFRSMKRADSVKYQQIIIEIKKP